MQVQVGQLWRTVAGNVVEVLVAEDDGYIRVRQLSRGLFRGDVFTWHDSHLTRCGGRLLGYRTARFWDYRFGTGEGWVKLTVRYGGRPLSFGSFRYTDEGWERSGETYEHTGDGVRLSWFNEGVDCDGRLDRGGESFCPLSSLSAHDGHDGTPCPAWESVESSQRDYAAEAAGY